MGCFGVQVMAAPLNGIVDALLGLPALFVIINNLRLLPRRVHLLAFSHSVTSHSVTSHSVALSRFHSIIILFFVPGS
jgi:hypothetical protein